MFQLRFAAGAVLAEPDMSAQRLGGYLLGALGWLCATWQVYLLNGLCDQVEDRRNGSGRPLAAGALEPARARLICRGLGVAGLLLAAAASLLSPLLVAAFLLLGWHYSAARRPQKSNVLGFFVTVTGGGVLTYLAGCFAVGGAFRPELLVLASAMSLWMGCAGMTKDLGDVDGDRLAGRRTLPVVLGPARARFVVAALTLAAAGYLVGWALLAAPDLLLEAVVLLVGAVACSICSLVSATAATRDRQRRPYRMFMLSQYAVHFAVLSAW